MDEHPRSRPARPGLLSPSRLQPAEIDLRKALLAGIGLWFLAGCAAAALAAGGRVEWRTVAVCAVGAALGGLGLLWERRRRRRQAGPSGEPTPPRS